MQGLLLVCSSEEIAKANVAGAASWIVSLLPNVMFHHFKMERCRSFGCNLGVKIPVTADLL